MTWNFTPRSCCCICAELCPHKPAFTTAPTQGFGWAIAKALAEAGAEISLGVWVPALNIFESSLRRGKFDASRKLSDGSLMEFAKIYPMDAVFDSPDDVPEEVLLLLCVLTTLHRLEAPW